MRRPPRAWTSLGEGTGQTLGVDRVLERLEWRGRRDLLLLGQELRRALQVVRDVARCTVGAEPLRRGQFLWRQVLALLQLSRNVFRAQADLRGDGLGRGVRVGLDGGQR